MSDYIPNSKWRKYEKVLDLPLAQIAKHKFLNIFQTQNNANMERCHSLPPAQIAKTQLSDYIPNSK